MDRNWHAHWTMNNLLPKAKLRSIPLSSIIPHVVEGSKRVIERQGAHEMEGGRRRVVWKDCLLTMTMTMNEDGWMFDLEFRVWGKGNRLFLGEVNLMEGIE